MKKIMTRAHQIAKTLEGDYLVRLQAGLKKAWAESKTTKKAEVVKETAKAKMLTLFFEDVLGEERAINAWFPNGWLEENNIPKMWALRKKESEIRNLHSEWDLRVKRVQMA